MEKKNLRGKINCN